MKNYIYENMWTQEMEDKVEASIAKPLVIELYYKYALKVYGVTQNGKFLMTLDGLPYCTVHADEVIKIAKDGSTQTPVITYYLRSMVYRKERGRDDNDKRTLSSTRIANLIRSVEKNKAIPSSADELLNDSWGNNPIKSLHRATERGISKGTRVKRILDVVSNDDIHEMIKVLAGNKEKKELSNDIIIRSKVLLDDWNKVDDNVSSFRESMRTMFENEHYIIHSDLSDGIVIGKFTAKLNDLCDDINSFEMVEPMQRVKSLEDYHNANELIPTMMMLKLHLESTGFNPERIKNGIPYTDSYISDLNVTTYYTDHGSYYGGAWIFVPLSINPN